MDLHTVSHKGGHSGVMTRIVLRKSSGRNSKTEAQGLFRLSMELQTKTPAIYEAFLQQLDAAGVKYRCAPEHRIARDQ